MNYLNPRALIGVVVSVVCVLVILRQVNLEELAATLAHTDPLMVFLTVALIPPAMYLKAVRWRLLFPDPESARRAGLVPALYVGYMVNSVAPLRMGELVRAYLVGHQGKQGVSTTIATIVLEKLFDIASLLVILLILAATVPLPDWAMAAAGLSAVGLVVGVVGAGVAVVAEQPMLRLARWFEALIPPLQKLHLSALLESFLAGLRALRSPRTLLLVIVLSALLWGTGYFGLATAVLSVGVTPSLGLVFFLMVVSNLGMSVPSAPGYVGVYHALVILSLGAFGIAETTALSAGIVLHSAVFGTFLVGGLLYLWRGNYALGQLLRGARESAEA